MSDSPAEKARKWNQYGRHLTRGFAVLFMPIAIVLHMLKAILDTWDDLKNNICHEMDVNWQDFKTHWKLGSMIATEKDFKKFDTTDEDED